MGLTSRRWTPQISRLAGTACLTVTACQLPPSSVAPPPDFGDCPVSYFDGNVPVPPVHLSMPVFFRFSAHVPLGAEGVQVDIEDARGTIRVGSTKPMQAFVFNVSDWSYINRTVYQGLAVTDGAWIPFWLYCTDDGTLDQVWTERTDRPGWTSAIVSGTCAATSEDATVGIDLPANTLRNVALTCGFQVSSPPMATNGQVDLGGSRPGQMTYPGYAATILVFNTYDCRVGCGSRSFFELHSIMWDAARNNVGFQIWYLDPLVSGVVTDNTVVLPKAMSLNVAFPDATWQLGNP